MLFAFIRAIFTPSIIERRDKYEVVQFYRFNKN